MMGVNPPEDENFLDVNTGETVVNNSSGPNLGDVQAAQLAIYQANVEKRDPDFTNIDPEAVKAAGYDPETSKPFEAAAPGAPLPTLTEQSPIVTADQQANTADVIADPAKLGEAKDAEQAAEGTEPEVTESEVTEPTEPEITEPAAPAVEADPEVKNTDDIDSVLDQLKPGNNA